MSEPLSIWVVYDHPADYPEGYLARRWRVTDDTCQATDESVTGTRLETVRARLPAHLVRLARDPEDDPVIVETWI